MTVNFASPITVDEARNAGREVQVLLRSSPASWTQAEPNIQPNFELYPQAGFPAGEQPQSYVLAVAVQGAFESAFKGKPAPLAGGEEGGETSQQSTGVIEMSPETARLVVVGSGEFLDDIIFRISSALTQDRYLNSLQFLQNAVSWSTEDLDLLSIRSRGTYARVLRPMSEREQSLWEGANYVLALLALVVIGVVWNLRTRNEVPMELVAPGKESERETGSAEVGR